MGHSTSSGRTTAQTASQASEGATRATQATERVEWNGNIGRYKGYDIERDAYGGGEYTVQYMGDDFFFNSVERAVRFIDELDADEESRRTTRR